MAQQANPHRIELPCGWPQRVRSAMLHVIALSQYATAYTHSREIDGRITHVRFPTACPSEKPHPRCSVTWAVVKRGGRGGTQLGSRAIRRCRDSAIDRPVSRRLGRRPCGDSNRGACSSIGACAAPLSTCQNRSFAALLRTSGPHCPTQAGTLNSVRLRA
jgi:hypothetical protein